MDTKTYIFIYFYEQYLVLFTIVLRNNSKLHTNSSRCDTAVRQRALCALNLLFLSTNSMHRTTAGALRYTGLL